MMKRKIAIAGISVTLLLGGAVGVGAFANTNSDSTSINEAKPELISDEKVRVVENVTDKTGGTVKEVEVEKDDNQIKYELDKAGFEEVEVEVDKNRENLDVEAEKITVNEKKQKNDANKQKENTNKQINTKASKISIKEAIAIALKDTPGTVEEADYDSDGYYEIEIKNKKHDEVEIKVDAKTGKIIEKEIDN